MRLHLGTQTLKVDDNLLMYNNIITPYIDTAIKAATEYVKLYSSANNIENALKKFDEHLSRYQGMLIAKSCKALFDRGIYDVTESTFNERYDQEYLDISGQISSVTDAINEILNYASQLENRLQQKQDSRGYWSGGGFGVGGAIKGALTASAMNAVGGIFHGVGDLFTSCRNDAKVRAKKEQLFKNPSTPYTLGMAIFEGCYRCFFGLYDELVEHDLIEPIEFCVEEAAATQVNALKYAKDDQLLQELLTRSVCMAPYTDYLYKPLFQKFRDTEGLNEFAHFFQVDKIYSFKQNLLIQKKLAEISALPENTISEQCKKLVAYLSLSADFNSNIDNELNVLEDTIVKKSGSSVSEITNALDYITKNLPEEYRDTAAPFLQSLNAKRIHLKQQRDMQGIDKIGTASAEDWAKRLKAIVDFSAEYNTDETEQVLDAIKEIAKKCVEPDTIGSAVNLLNGIDSPRYEQIKLAASALEIRRKFALADSNSVEIETSSLLFVIFGLINNARNGNVTCQQWLDSLFFTETSGGEMPSEELIDVLSYLFDKPEKYPFDLFMRLKCNSSSLSEAEYVNAISAFSESRECVVGMYEYGKRAYSLGNRHAGIQAIKGAANHGHSQAISFLHELCAASDPASKAALFYQVLMLSDPKDKLLLGEEYQGTFKVFLKQIRNLIYGEYNFFTAGANRFSLFLGSTWCTFEQSRTSKYCIGYFSENREVAQELKRASAFLEIPRQETPLFSYMDAPSNEYRKAIVFTSGAAYWSMGDSIYIKRYHSPLRFEDIDSVCTEPSIKPLLAHIYTIIYYSCTPYRPDLDVPMLKKMAYCGHPWAISNLLVNPNYHLGEDRRDVWISLKRKWAARGQSYAVCSRCLSAISSEDVFCPNCGKKK